MGMLDIGENAAQQNAQSGYRVVERPSQVRQQVQQTATEMNVGTSEQDENSPALDFPVDPEIEAVKAKEERRGKNRFFNITETQGQVRAGDPDKAYREHLKNTEWAD